jgi:hypothetical protein
VYNVSLIINLKGAIDDGNGVAFMRLLMELCKEDKWSYAIEEKRSAKE